MKRCGNSYEKCTRDNRDKNCKDNGNHCRECDHYKHSRHNHNHNHKHHKHRNHGLNGTKVSFPFNINSTISSIIPTSLCVFNVNKKPLKIDITVNSIETSFIDILDLSTGKVISKVKINGSDKIKIICITTFVNLHDKETM